MANKIDVKLILELLQTTMSQREIVKTRHISSKSIMAVCRRAAELGVSYADLADKSDDEVYLLFFPDKFQKETMYAPVNYEYIHSELKKTGVTLKLLWQEYKEKARDGIPVGYTKFCDDYAKYVEQNNLTNHITHKPGVVCEVDWSGKTMRLHDTDEGNVYPVYLFVATLPYSQLAYVEPCLNMNEQTWIGCNIHMFEYFGGVTLRIVCDNLKTGVATHLREGDIVLNQCYEDFSNYYCTAIMPAGVKKPKQKASVEGTVGKIATAIIARLRNNEYTSIYDLKTDVAAALEDFNNKPFQKREGSRREVFEANERITLRPLPAFPYEYASLVNVHYEKRGLDKNLILELGSCGFIEKNQPIVFNGFTGSGKSYLACAIGRQACMQGFRTRYIRIPDLMQLLSEAILDVQGKAKLLKKFSGYKLLILDEWLLNDLTDSEQHFIFELIERRYDCTSTVFCTQYKREDWHSRLGGGIHADADARQVRHQSINPFEPLLLLVDIGLQIGLVDDFDAGAMNLAGHHEPVKVDAQPLTQQQPGIDDAQGVIAHVVAQVVLRVGVAPVHHASWNLERFHPRHRAAPRQ